MPAQLNLDDHSQIWFLPVKVAYGCIESADRLGRIGMLTGQRQYVKRIILFCMFNHCCVNASLFISVAPNKTGFAELIYTVAGLFGRINPDLTLSDIVPHSCQCDSSISPTSAEDVAGR